MQTSAFVLSSQTSGESDRTYHLLTDKLGLIEAFAKSIEKPTSKLAGHLEPPNYIWVELIESNKGWQITSALEETDYGSVLKAPDILRTVLQAAFIMKELIPVSYPDPALLDLWKTFLDHAESEVPNATPEIGRGILAQFVTKILLYLGFLPSPFSCSACRRRFHRESVFVHNGELLCGDCAKNASDATVITPKILGMLQDMVRDDWIPGKLTSAYGIWRAISLFAENAKRLMV